MTYLRRMIRIFKEVDKLYIVNGYSGVDLARYLLSENVTIDEAQVILEEEGFEVLIIQGYGRPQLRVRLLTHSSVKEGGVIEWVNNSN